MKIEDVLTNLAINLFAGVIIFILGLTWPMIPKSIAQLRFRKFWGKLAPKNRIRIAFGTLIDSRLLTPPIPQFRFVKRFHDGRSAQLVGPWGNVVGETEIRSSSYLINALGHVVADPIQVIPDTVALAQLDNTIVALGSSSSNEITELILRQTNNTFLIFDQDTDFHIKDIATGRKFYGFQQPIKKDYGMVLKLKNTRFPGSFLFVCAGLGEWGTSGASWYLARHWKSLRSEETFGIVVEVEIGSDSSAVKVFPA